MVVLPKLVVEPSIIIPMSIMLIVFVFIIVFLSLFWLTYNEFNYEDIAEVRVYYLQPKGRLMNLLSLILIIFIYSRFSERVR